jgi:tetratricopeptide (TPR) repeat protein
MSDVARNAPCPCGSNRRYKDCHGALGSAPVEPDAAGLAAAPEAVASYRPAGADWAELSEAERDHCATLMARALEHQLAERFDAAAEIYSAVLAKAPRTHDALHMLGAIKMRRGELREARRLIVTAMRLRAPYAAIEHNLQLIQDAERVIERLSVRRPASTELCERALPILADHLLSARDPETRARRAGASAHLGTTGPVHVIQATPGTEVDPGWFVRRLAAILAATDLHLWTADGSRESEVVGRKLRRIAPELGLFPRGGCHLFVGIDIACTEWIDRAEAERVIVICQPAPAADFLDQLRALAWDGRRSVELVFPSQAMAARFGSGHAVLPPPAELRSHPPALSRDKDSARARLAGLQVGVIGRNWRGEAPAKEAQFLTQIAAGAGTLALYDAGLLRFNLGGDASVHFHPRRPDGLEPFLDAVDILLVYPEPWWREGDGRELFTAMASGVPVLCPAGSIYAEYIAEGVDGLLYRSRAEAVQQLVELRRAPTRVASLGAAARAKAARLLDAPTIAGCVGRLVTGNASPAEPGPSEPPLRAITL